MSTTLFDVFDLIYFHFYQDDTILTARF